jgi:hypothetical protein
MRRTAIVSLSALLLLGGCGSLDQTLSLFGGDDAGEAPTEEMATSMDVAPAAGGSDYASGPVPMPSLPQAQAAAAVEPAAAPPPPRPKPQVQQAQTQTQPEPQPQLQQVAALPPPAAPAPAADPVNNPGADPAADPEKLIGLDRESTQELLGQPNLQQAEPPAQVWYYTATDCTLRVFFYLELETTTYRALHYEMTRNDTAQLGERSCISQIFAEAKS